MATVRNLCVRYWDLNRHETSILDDVLSLLFDLLIRRILLPDTNPCLFYKFLEYLYSGILDTRSLSMDEVPEMLALSDKYEVWQKCWRRDHLNGGQREQSFDCCTKPGAHIPKLSIFIDWAILSDFLSWFDTFLISYSWPYWSDSLVICNASDWLKGSLYVTPKWLRLLISLSFSHFRLLFYFWRLQIKSNFGFWWGE